MVAVVLDKASGQTSTVATSDISISRPSTIRLNLSPSDISSSTRSGTDLIINLNNGEQIRIDGFFTGEGDKRSDLVLEDDLGNTWAGEYTDALADLQFEPLGAVDQMVGAAAAGGGGSGLGVLGALGLIGAGLAAAGLGGGGGKDNDDGGGEEPGTPGPDAPTVTLGDGDNLLNAEETAGGTVVVTIDLTGTGAVAGNTLTVNGNVITLTAEQIAAGSVEINLPAPGEGQALTVTASLTDADGNSSPLTTVSAVVDTIAPTTPSVTVGDGDAFINESEIVDGKVTVRVDIAGTGAAAGDRLTVNGETIVLTASQISAGFVNTAVTVPGEGQTLTVTTSLTDAAGNSSPPTSFTATVDTTAPGTPAISLGDGDGVILASELENGSVPIRISLGGTGAAAGDTLTVNGVVTALTAEQIEAGFVETSVPALADGAQLTVTASLTDAAGNSSADASATAVMNTDLLGAPTITLGDGDAYINASEVIDGEVTVSVNLNGTGATAGGTLTVNGEVIQLTADDIAAGSVTTQVTAPADGETLSVTATLADGNGRTSPPITVTAPVDTSAPDTPTFVVGNGDAFITAGEIANGAVEVRVNLTNTGAKAGDRLTVNGTTIVLTAEQIAAAEVATTVPVPASGQTLSVHASLTDVAGNSSQITTVSFLVDTTPPGQPVLTIGNGDGYINADEIVDDEIEVSISIANTGAVAGDILTVNGETIPLTAAMISAGVVTTNVAAPADGEQLSVTASITDAAGNVSTPVTLTAEVDISEPGAPQVTVGNGDAFISAQEVTDGMVSVRVDLTGTDARVGDTLTVNGTAITITQADLTANAVVTTVDVPPSGQTLNVAVSITDVAGNVSPTTNLPLLVDTDPLGLPVITIGDGNEFIDANEVIDGRVALSISIANTGAVAGDSLNIAGQQPIVLTQQQIDAGVVETSIEVPTDGSPLLVEATLSDPAGNTSPVASVSAIVDVDVPTIPGLVVGDGDLYINASEIVDGRVSVTVDIANTGAKPGDSLIVNGTAIVLTGQQITDGQVTTTVAAAANGQTLVVTAQLSDVAGNLSQAAQLELVTDTSAPTLPVLTLGDGDDYINLSEVVDGAVTLRIDIATTGAVAGDTLTISGLPPIVLTQADIDAGFIETDIAVPTDGQPLEVTASLTDVAGNISPVAEVSATVDLLAPTAPTVTVGNGSGFVGIDDVTNGTVAVSIDIGDADEGDTLTVNGQNFVLTQAQINTGLFNTTVPAATDGGTLTVNVSLTDAAGNSTSVPPVTATMDLTAPGLPLVTLGDGDGLINALEAAGGVEVTVTLTNTGAQVGDTLTIAGQAPFTVTAEMITDGLTITIPAPLDGETLSVDVTLTDRAGNNSPTATAQAVVDTVAPDAPGVFLGIDGDGTINLADLDVDGAVPVRIDLGTDAKAGDRLTVNGTTTVLTQADIDAGSVELSLPTPGDGATLTVDATITDAAGNVSGIGTASATIETGIPGAPALTIGANGDGFITAAEIIGGNVSVRADLANTGAAVGDTLTIGAQTFVLTQDDLDAGFVTASFTAPAEGQPLTITGSLTSSGNPSPVVTVSAVVDTIAPGPVGVEIGNGDGFIVAGEISGGSVNVTIDLDASAAAGYTLNVNGTTRVLTAADITAGNVQVALSAPTNGQQLTVNASLSDLAGNTSPITTVSALVDTTAPGLPVITLGNGDGFILPEEISNNTVSVSVSIAGTGAAPGDILTINGNQIQLTPEQIAAGTVTTTVTAPLDGATLNVTASLTDAAGNSSAPASASAIADLTVPTAPTVTLGNGDAFINAAEVSGGRVAVSININGTGAAIGDRLIVNGTTIVLNAGHISSGTVATTVAAPTNGQTLTVTAIITDTAGNISLPGTANALVDTTIPTAPIVSIGNGDAFIGIGEISAGSVSVSVNLAGTGAAIGDRLVVNGTTIVLTAEQITAGTASTNILAPGNGATLTVNASITDAAGNTSTIATASAVVDTTAPTAPVITLGNGDAYINASEVTAGSVAVSLSLAGTGAVAGDRLTVNGTTFVLTAAQITAGVFATTVPVPASGSNLTVSASLTDAAGNTSSVASVSAAVDTIAPAVPTVTFLNDTGTIGDGISTDGTIRVTGIEPGARWEYSTNGGTTWSLGSGTGFTLGAGSYNVQVRQTDAAGNTSTRTLGPVQIINLVANDDATTIPLTINQQVVTQPKQTGAVGGVLNLGLLGNAVDVSLLAGQSPLRFSVAENTTQQVSVKGAGAALAALNLLGEQNYDLLVYRVEDGQNQAEKVYELRDWLVFNPGILGLLLPSWSGSTIALPQFEGGGTYYVVLANPGGLLNLSALANMTLETTNNVVTDYRPVTGSVSGNVLTDDTTVTGTIVSSVDQLAVGTTGLVIRGDHGTLTISRNGTYTYQADPLYTGADGDQDVFTYTIRSPDGSTSTAELTITIDYPHGPQATFTASIEEVGTDDLFSMAMALDDDPLDPGTVHAHTENNDITHAAAVDGHDPAVPDEPAFEDLLLDQGGQEIDLSGLADLPQPDPSPMPETASTEPAAVAAPDITDDLPIDPFPVGLSPEDQLHHASVV